MLALWGAPACDYGLNSVTDTIMIKCYRAFGILAVGSTLYVISHISYLTLVYLEGDLSVIPNIDFSGAPSDVSSATYQRVCEDNAIRLCLVF